MIQRALLVAYIDHIYKYIVIDIHDKYIILNIKIPSGIFPRHEAMCEPSGRADAADCCRGGAHRGEDKSTGSGVPTHTTDPARSAG